MDGSARPNEPRVSKPLIGLLLFAIYRFSESIIDAPFRTCADEAPLVEKSPAFISPDECAALLGRVLAQQNEDNRLSEKFSSSKGFVFRFNKEGLTRLASSSSYAFLAPIVDRMRDPLANAFVLNALIMPLVRDDAKHKASIGVHVDDTVGIDSTSRFLAHSVTVLYLSVPEQMAGGELQLFNYSRREGLRESDAPDAIVRPSEGLLATFRGDALHRVTEASLNPNRWRSLADGGDDALETSARVSLVLEQYRIPESHYEETLTFVVEASGVDIRSYGNQWKSIGLKAVKMSCKGAIALLLCSSWLKEQWDRFSRSSSGTASTTSNSKTK